jgi:hypothetical protein
VAACQLKVLAVSLTDIPIPGARKLASAARQLAPPPKQPPSLECHLQVGAARVQGLENLEVLLVEDEATLITETWQDITGGPSFEPAPPPPPPGACSSEGEAPAAGGGGAPGAARPGTPPAAAPFPVARSPPPAATPAPEEAAAAAAPDSVSPAAAPEPAVPPVPAATPAASGSRSGAAPPGPRLVFVVCQTDVAGALAKVPEVLGDMDTLDLSGLGLGSAGANEVAQVGLGKRQRRERGAWQDRSAVTTRRSPLFTCNGRHGPSSGLFAASAAAAAHCPCLLLLSAFAACPGLPRPGRPSRRTLRCGA